MEETKPLFRLLRTEAFRFIIIRYNHYSLVNQLKEDLLRLFPDRPVFTVNSSNTNYRSLVDSYYKAAKGFFIIENFEEVLSNPEIYTGLNQRRDKLALYPIALIVFISSGTEELYARQIMEKMPDLWSFRSLLLDLKVEAIQLTSSEDWHQNLDMEQLNFSPLEEKTQTPHEIHSEITYQDVDPKKLNHIDSTLGGSTAIEKEIELNRLLTRIKSVSSTEINFLRIAYEQIAKLLVDLWKFDEAIEYYLKLEKIEIEIGDQVGLGTTYNDIGFIFSQKGDFKKSLEYYLKSEGIRSKEGNKAALGTIYNNIGGIYSENGDWEIAYNYYMNAEQMFLTCNHDEGLGATYNNIGGYYIHKNDWKEALSYLLKSEKRRLDCGDTKGLGTTYFNLGFVYSQIGDLSSALELYIKSEKLLVEYEDIERLRILFLRISDIYSSIKDWSKAIDYYQKLAEIEQKVGNKKGIGEALNYLGIATSNMGDSNKALAFHHQAEIIRYDIGDDSGLIQTLYNIGMEWLRIKNAEKAVDYFTLAGYIAKKKGMNFELKQMDWAIRELIKKHGHDRFMNIGEKFYKSWIKHFE